METRYSLRWWLTAPPKELFAIVEWTYVPLFLAYFAHSFSGMYGMGLGLTTVPATFWFQEELIITASALAALQFSLGIPWISKPLLGQLVDSWSIRTRKNTLFITGVFTGAGYLILAGLAAEHEWVMQALPLFGPTGGGVPEEAARETLRAFQFSVLALGYVVVSGCMALQDVILDPLGRHLISTRDANGRPRSKEERNDIIGKVQVWCRISFNAASLLGMIAASILMARGIGMDVIYTIAMFTPVMILACVRFINPPQHIATTPRNKRMILLALAVVLVSIVTQVIDLPTSREVAFVATLSLIGMLVFLLNRRQDTRISGTRFLTIMYTAITLFLLNIVPSAGPGVSWWQRAELGFDRQFEAMLGIGSASLSVLFLFFLYPLIVRGHLGKLLLALVCAGSLLTLPSIAFWHGFHEYLGAALGVEPIAVVRAIVWLELVASSPIGLISSLVIFIFLITHATDDGTATWLTIFAAFFNLGMNASGITTGYLNQIFVVTRTDFSNIGNLLWSSWSIGLLFSVIVIVLFLTPWREPSCPLAHSILRRLRGR